MRTIDFKNLFEVSQVSLVGMLFVGTRVIRFKMQLKINVFI